jgi:hypothetical protein
MKKITSMLFLFVTALGFAQMPTAAAPTPPARIASDVISIYSDAYTNIANVNINPNWGQSTVTTQIQIAGNNTLQYVNLNYQGTDWESNTQNITNMQFLHVDIWTNAVAPNVYVISSGTEIAIPITAQPGSWKSVDIPVANITGNLTGARQFKFDNGNGGTIYLDNLYFWKPAAPAGTPIYGTFTVPTKTVGDAAFALTAPTSTSPAPFTYLSSNTMVATIVGNIVTVVGAGTAIITASQVASGTFLAGSTTASFLVNAPTPVPTVAAPTPPARNPVDVISLFSNAYNNIAVDEWSTSWDSADIFDLLVAGNATKRINFTNFLGVDFVSSRFNASTMTRFHIDYWIPAGTDLTGKVFNPKWSHHGGGANEVSAFTLTHLPSVAGSWQSIDVAITAFDNSPQTRTDLKQFLITSNLGNNIYIDNLYLYREATASATTFDALSVKMYPNPATNLVTIEALAPIQNVSLFNILGQEVLTKSATTNSLTLDISSLQAGVYVAKTNIDGQVATSRIVKQ